MNVGELKQLLNNHSDTTPVAIYMLETQGTLEDVQLHHPDKLYCKADNIAYCRSKNDVVHLFLMGEE